MPSGADLTDEIGLERIFKDEERKQLETFRCPTCVGVLTDATATRCSICGQGLRRKRPRVLGEEHRLAGRLLPVDRWMVERLYGEHRRKRTMPPAAWHGRFTPSPASAEPEVQRPPVIEPPAPNPIEPSLRHLGGEIDALTDLGEPITAEMVLDEQPPATVDALHLDMFVAPASPQSSTPPVRQASEEQDFASASFESPVAAPPPAASPPIPRPVVSHESLDPEVRALVDELYEQARAEMSGTDLRFDEPVTEMPATEPEMRLPTGEPAIDVYLPEPEPAPAPAPEPPVPPAAPSASTTSAVGDVITPSNGSSESRGGWVPAFVAEDQQRRITD